MPKTKKWLQGLIASVLAVAMSATQAQSDRFKEVVVESTKLTESVYMLTGAGGNIGVSIGTDGLLIIDDQYAPLADRIAAALEDVALQSGYDDVVKYVINTHFHGDHTGNNGFFGAQGATIVANELVRVRLLDKEDSPGAALPVITYSDGINVHFNGERLQLTALKGHTDGDSSVLFTKANVLHTGDLLFNQRFPFIDLKHGGDVDDYIESQAYLLTLVDENTRVIPGHGPLGDRQDLLTMHEMIKTTYAQVKTDIAAGLNLEQILAKGVADKYQQYSWAFINEARWLETLYSAASQ